VLEELRGKHPVVDLILENRELAKLKSTYLDALPLQVNRRDGRIHTSFNQTGAATGRLSSADPNLQNIPTRTELGRRVRNAFIADEGCVLLSVDYSQIELRIVADVSQDAVMLEAFRKGEDIHAATAAAVHNIPLDKVTKAMRRDAKAVNFGLIYGMSAFGLTRTTGLTLAEAEDFVRNYFKQFPGVRKYLDDTKRLAGHQGYVETLSGRRRFFPNLINPVNQTTRAREEREAINSPIQGTAADIMKEAMIRVYKALAKINSPARMLLLPAGAPRDGSGLETVHPAGNRGKVRAKLGGNDRSGRLRRHLSACANTLAQTRKTDACQATPCACQYSRRQSFYTVFTAGEH